jgi:hypothetical protein
MASIYSSQTKLDPTKFSPLTLHYAVLEPLKYLFSFVPSPDLRFHEDPKETKIIIGSVNDKHTDAEVQGKPRILLNRGTYTVGKMGLTDSMVDGKPFSVSGGLKEQRHATMIQGYCAITIEASTEGVCELLADMVHHFIVWSRPNICSTFRFREFGLPLQVSEAQLDSEDTEKFKIMISVPYSLEDSWILREDALKLHGFITHLVLDE